MRKTALDTVKAMASRDERICFIGSDLGYGVMDDFPAPERLFREGISEQHVIGMAAGLALEGKIVYVNTIASFLIRRCYEQVYLDLCLNRANVCLIGSGGGLVYAPLGPTHLLPDDFALLRPLPHMTILAPCDAEEMRLLLLQTPDMDEPVYVRSAKGGDRVITQTGDERRIGKAAELLKGDDVLFITTGIAAQRALEAAELLQGKGVSAGVLHCHTVAPLDKEAICTLASRYRLVATVEEHVLTGGLGSAVAEIFSDNALGIRLRRFALPDSFFVEHGSQDAILSAYGLDAQSLCSAIETLLDV